MQWLGLLALLAPVWASVVSAQDLPGDPEAGEKLAREVCAACHLVAADQQEDPDVGAPAFSDVAAQPFVTARSLRVFFQTPHAAMPNLMLTAEETDNIISYILTLKGAGGARAEAGRAVRLETALKD
jgi:mono/diheme cytochrome c family protein